MVRSLLAIGAPAACGGSTSEPTAREMNPLGSTNDILPYPSSLYERAEPSSPTGVLLDLDGSSLPAPTGAAPIDAPARRLDHRTAGPPR